MSDMQANPQRAPMVKVWDPVVRLTHWVFVGGFAAAYVSAETGYHLVHHWSGYIVGVAALVRVVWGFTGPEQARFRDFVTAPGRAARWVAELVRGAPTRYRGHNPAGGWMTLALLALTLALVWSGMAALAMLAGTGPLGALYGGGGEGSVTGIGAWHVPLAWAGLALIVLHVIGVLVAGRLQNEDLVRGMVTGYKRA